MMRKSLKWLPAMAAALLMIMAGVGIARIFCVAQVALAGVSTQEAKSMSVAYDRAACAAEDYNNNTYYGSYAILNTPQWVDRNGIQVDGRSDVFKNLLGTYSGFDTLYLGDEVVKQPDMEEQFHLLTGTKRADSAYKEIDLTLDSKLQEDLYGFLENQQIRGSITVTQASTGEILACVSHTLEGQEKWLSQSQNQCLRLVSPGSTMKVVSLLVLEALGADLDEGYTCTGAFTELDGITITDSGVHGYVKNADAAIAYSCNCYFAHKLSAYSTAEVAAAMEKLGIRTDGKWAFQHTAEGARYRQSTMSFGSDWSFESLFSMIGETAVLMSPLQMCNIISAIGTEGQGEQGHFLSTTQAEPLTTGWPEALASDGIRDVGYRMRNAREDYLTIGFDDRITMMKTGTTEFDSGHTLAGRRLLAYSESLDIAFYFVWDNWKEYGSVSSEMTLQDASTKIIDMIAAAESEVG